MAQEIGVRALSLTLVVTATKSTAAGITKTGEIFILLDPIEAAERVRNKFVRRALSLDDHDDRPPRTMRHE